jgi:hypothetical protein
MAAGLGIGCDNAEEFPFGEEQTFPEDSAPRYFGKLQTTSDSPTTLEDGTLVYEFDPSVPAEPLPTGSGNEADFPDSAGRGPSCLYGAPYRVLAQRGPEDGPNNLAIQLQGGGGNCFVDDQFPCLIGSVEAASTWPVANDLRFTQSNEEANPLTHDWDRIFMPNCDYSLYSSDTNAAPHQGNRPEEERYFRGVQNFTAGMQIAKEINPNPDKVLLTGPLGGGYAAVVNTPIVAAIFPDADIYVYSEGGSLMGIFSPDDCETEDLTCVTPDGEAEVCACTSEEFLANAVDDFNANFYIPDECEPGCLADGTLWKAAGTYVNLNNENRTLRLGVSTSIENIVIGTLFLEFGNAELPVYGAAFLAAFNQFEEDTAASTGAGFIANGTSSISGNEASIGGVTLETWLQDMVSNEESWDTVEGDLDD